MTFTQTLLLFGLGSVCNLTCQRTFAISHNTWLHKIVEVGVRPLTSTPVTPNQVTTLRLIAGVGAAAMFAIGENDWVIAASVLFTVSILLDRADGVLARLNGKTSIWGHRYDLISDSLCNALAFVGIGIGLKESALGTWSILLGIIAGAAVSAVLWLVMRAEERDGRRAAELGGRAGFDPDDALLLVPVAMLLGWGMCLITAAAIGASIFAVFFFWKFRSFLRSPN